MLSKHMHNATTTTGRASLSLRTTSTSLSLRDRVCKAGAMIARGAYRDFVHTMKKATTWGKKLVYMRNDTFDEWKAYWDTPISSQGEVRASTGDRSLQEPTLGWWSNMEGHTVLLDTRKLWPKKNGPLLTLPPSTCTRGYVRRMDSILMDARSTLRWRVAKLGQSLSSSGAPQDVPSEVDRIFREVVRMDKKERMLSMGNISQMCAAVSRSMQHLVSRHFSGIPC